MSEGLVMILALILGALLEGLAPAFPMLGQAKLPAMLSVVVYYALARSPGLMVAAALCGGILHDALCALPLGASPLAFAGCGFLVRQYRDIVFGHRVMTRLLLGAIAGAIVVPITLAVLLATEPAARELSPAWIVLKLIGSSLQAMILVPLVHLGLHRIDQEMGHIASQDTDDEFDAFGY